MKMQAFEMCLCMFHTDTHTVTAISCNNRYFWEAIYPICRIYLTNGEIYNRTCSVAMFRLWNLRPQLFPHTERSPSTFYRPVV